MQSFVHTHLFSKLDMSKKGCALMDEEFLKKLDEALGITDDENAKKWIEVCYDYYYRDNQLREPGKQVPELMASDIIKIKQLLNNDHKLTPDQKKFIIQSAEEDILGKEREKERIEKNRPKRNFLDKTLDALSNVVGTSGQPKNDAQKNAETNNRIRKLGRYIFRGY